MRQRKIRVGKTSQVKATAAYVITIPPELAEFYKDTYFNVYQSGTNIVLISGTLISNLYENLSGIKLVDYRI